MFINLVVMFSLFIYITLVACFCLDHLGQLGLQTLQLLTVLGKSLPTSLLLINLISKTNPEYISLPPTLSGDVRNRPDLVLTSHSYLCEMGST